MGKHILTLISAITLGTSVAVAQMQEQAKQKYTCPMHPEVVMDHPGNCPKCGMKLVPLKQEKRRTPNAERPTPKVGAIDPNRPGHEHEHKKMHMEMHSSIDIADPMNREGSG